MFETITLNLTPTGDRPVLHLSQYDVGRPFGVALMWGEDDYALPEGVSCELRMRKTDSHLVSIEPDDSSENVLVFMCIEQMCTCPGLNIAQLVILDENDNIIHSLTFDIEVQRDVMQGGMSSASDIHNLETQIEEITQEVLGEDYYTKTEVDDLINSIPTFDPTNYYDKSDVDTLLANKADISDLPDMSNYYTKSEVDTLLATKQDKVQTATIENVSTATLTDAADDVNLSELLIDVTATQEGTGTPTPTNPRNINGHSSCTLSVNSVDTTIAFGDTYYIGVLNVLTGELTVTSVAIDMGDMTWNYNSTYAIFYTSELDSVISTRNVQDLMCEIYRITELSTAAGNTVWQNEETYTIGKKVTSNVWYIYCKNSDYTSSASFTTAMSGYKLVYALDTPTVITLTPEEIKSIAPTTTITADTGNVNKVVYFKSGCENIVKLIEAYKGA